MRGGREQIARAGALLCYGAWFLALGGLLEHRDYEAFLHPAFGPLLAFATVGLAALLLVTVGAARPAAAWDAPGFARCILLLAPLAYLPLAREATLDGAAFDRRWSGRLAAGEEHAGPVGPANAGAPSDAAPREVNLLDLLRAPPAPAGRRVAVTGVLRRGPEVEQEFGADASLLYRFAIRCCVADAVPVVVLLRGALPGDCADGSWVRVSGPFAFERRAGASFPCLHVEQAARMPAPRRPFL